MATVRNNGRTIAKLEDSMESGKKDSLTLLDRSIIGLVVFIVMLLIGIQGGHAGR